MKVYRLVIRAGAAHAIRNLPPAVKRAVRAALDSLVNNPGLGTPLQAELRGRFKFRVRRYRIVYSLDRTQRVLNVLAVGHRRNIYEELAESAKTEDPK